MKQWIGYQIRYKAENSEITLIELNCLYLAPEKSFHEKIKKVLIRGDTVFG